MKKWIAGIVGIVGILIAAIGIRYKMKSAMAISIIGGADGPTSVFLAGKVGNGFSGAAIAAGILFIVIGLIILLRGRKK